MKIRMLVDPPIDRPQPRALTGTSVDRLKGQAIW